MKDNDRVIEGFIKIDEVCKLLGSVSPRTVYRMIKERGLPAHRVDDGSGNPYRFLASEVTEWLTGDK